jgi:GH15 family glucan-1,4-alpha-glucosidase
VEEKLVRQRGVIRYKDDKYYSNDKGEAEWTFGLPWLAKIYKDMDNDKKFREYMRKTHKIMTKKGDLPELYFAKSKKFNENTPLGWSLAMYLVAVI